MIVIDFYWNLKMKAVLVLNSSSNIHNMYDIKFRKLAHDASPRGQKKLVLSLASVELRPGDGMDAITIQVVLLWDSASWGGVSATTTRSFLFVFPPIPEEPARGCSTIGWLECISTS
jgi:hypothetical protein